MSAMTDYTEAAFLNWLLRAVAMPAETTRYLLLLTADPTDAGSFTSEPTGGTYARQAISAVMSAPGADGQISNTSVVSFGNATANHGTILWVAVADALTAGNMLAKAQLETALTYNTGDPMDIPIGELIWTAA